MVTKKKRVKHRSLTRKKKHHHTRWYVGTAGFMISQAEWLKLSPPLNCIEINSTFYRLPSKKSVEKWSHLPVTFSIKASKYITHIKRLKNVKGAWQKLWNIISLLKSKLKVVLFQLPPSFAYNPENIRRIVTMKEYLPTSVNIVFEFRNNSWFQKSVYLRFKTLKWCISATYIDKPVGSSWMGTMSSGLHIPPKTGAISYIRIHGQRGYRGSLDKKKLRELKISLAKLHARDNFVIFNNTFFTSRNKACNFYGHRITYAAVCNAIEFTQ